MSYSNQQIAKLIAQNLAKNKQPIFQKGTTTSTGINKELTVKLSNGKVVRALGWNVDTPGEVNIFWDAQNKRYVAWKESVSSLKRKVVLAKRKVRPDDKKITIPYCFVVGQNGGLIEGFALDQNLSTESLDLTEYNVIGVTNTSIGYQGILKNNNEYALVSSSNPVRIAQLNAVDFVGGIIPQFYYYGNNVYYNDYNYKNSKYKEGILLTALLNIQSTPDYPTADYHATSEIGGFYENSLSPIEMPINATIDIPITIGPVQYSELNYRFIQGDKILLYNSASTYMKGTVTSSGSSGVTVTLYIAVYEAVGSGTYSSWKLYQEQSEQLIDYDYNVYYSTVATFNPFLNGFRPFLQYLPNALNPEKSTNWVYHDLTLHAGFQRNEVYSAPSLLFGVVTIPQNLRNVETTVQQLLDRIGIADSVNGVDCSANTILTIETLPEQEDANDSSILEIELDSNYTANTDITGFYIDTFPSPDIFFWAANLNETWSKSKSVKRTYDITHDIEEIKVFPETNLYSGTIQTTGELNLLLTSIGEKTIQASTTRYNASPIVNYHCLGTMSVSGHKSTSWVDCYLHLYNRQIPIYMDRLTSYSGDGNADDYGSADSVVTKQTIKNINKIDIIFQGVNATLCQKINGQIKRIRTFDVDIPSLPATTFTSINNYNFVNIFEYITPLKKTYCVYTENNDIEFSLYGSFFAIDDNDIYYNIGNEHIFNQRLSVYPQKTSYVPLQFWEIFGLSGMGVQRPIPILNDITSFYVGGTGKPNPVITSETINNDIYMFEYVFGENEYLDLEDELLFFKPLSFANSNLNTQPVLHTLNRHSGKTLNVNLFLTLPDNSFRPYSHKFAPWLWQVTIDNTLYEDEDLVRYRGLEPEIVEIYTISNSVTTKQIQNVQLEWLTVTQGESPARENEYLYDDDYEWYCNAYKEKLESLGINPDAETNSVDVGFYMWANVYQSKTIIVSENNHNASIIEYLSIEENRKTANLYTILDDNGNETVELAIAQIPTQTEKQKEHRADIYRFNTTSLKWERRPNAVSPISELSTIPQHISYHPTPINKQRKKRF